jgi:S1-C subfamily serine protease
VNIKNKISLPIILLCTLTNLCFGDDASKIYDKYSSHIVNIESLTGTGTGFFLTPSYIITNRHVVFGYDTQRGLHNAPKKITTKSGIEIVTYKTLYCSKRADICMIELPQKHKDIKSSLVIPKKTALIKAGQAVYIIGHPEGFKVPIISTGIISSELSLLNWDDYVGNKVQLLGYATNSAISHGSSGSPVFSKNGEIIGVAVGGVAKNNAQNLNLIISYDELSIFLNQIMQNKSNDFFAFPQGIEKSLDILIKEKFDEKKKKNSSEDDDDPIENLLKN